MIRLLRRHHGREHQSSLSSFQLLAPMANTIALVGFFVLTLVLLTIPSSNGFVLHPSNLRCASRPAWSLQAEKLTSEEVRTRLEEEMQRLREKDRTSLVLKPEELNIVYEDEHIVVIDKPSGVLSTANAEEFPSLAKTAFERLQQQSSSGSTNNNDDTVKKMDQMVVHRLGMDTSGLVVFTKTMEALREMNSLFRTRKVTRQYEALVCGHLTVNEGLISLPLMRDYEHPPYMRVSTDDQQRHLLTLDPDIVGRKLLEAPKAATTHYQVLSREYLKDDNEDLPVTRVTLTSVSGRTHQLNVHCAASGHPIVQDTVYGWQGRAAPYGGLEDELPASAKCPDEVQAAIAQATKGQNMCVHAKLIRFRHPVKKEETVEFTSETPF